MSLPFYVYDLLQSETQVRWGASHPVGTPVTLTYSFPSSEPAGSSYPGYTPFTSVEIAAARNALAYISSITNISFVETTSADANLRFGNADLTGVGASTSGITDYGYDSSGLTYANIHLANAGAASQANSDFTPGSISSNDIGGQGWGTLLHELGHALGLKHPFQRNLANDPNSVLDPSLDNKVHTVMSYTSFEPSEVAVVTTTPGGYTYSEASLQPQGYSLYDIAALQYLYGRGPGSSGNKVYSFAPDAPIFETIYDRGPNDTIDCSALTGPCRIDLTPGASSDLAIQQTLPSGIGLADRYDGTSALTIAYGCAVANCFGGAGSDDITGNAGNNTIDGRGGADTMAGGRGNDVYYVDTAADIVDEVAGGGTDAIFTNVSYRLQTGSSVEVLRTTSTSGNAAINLTGNELANNILGDAGANRINGGGGVDKLRGYGGNDTYYVNNPSDAVYETANGGTDTVRSGGNYALAAGQSIERLYTTNSTSTKAINLSGNALGQTIVGNAGANRIAGGAGNDVLKGGAGPDTFVFDTALNASTNVDRISDFDVDADTLELSHAIFTALSTGNLSSDAFHVGAAAHDANDRVIYNSTTGALTYDSNGNAAGGATRFAILSTGLDLTAADFKVV